MATQRERLEQAMETHFGPSWYIQLADGARIRQYMLAAEGAPRDRIVRYMKNDALELCERMTAVCVTARMVTAPDDEEA